ncbi:acyltransferase [Pedobacter sp. JY14-1]|uniref:acyltransferase n=1 Tax=Pedobacter sp. JY14-1 TaxID=3034151 RepID=UPI0023E3234C|nr:acyltransferase [Pedobacter sp. JY14-1]
MLVKRGLNFVCRKFFHLVNGKKFAFLAPTANVQRLLRLDGAENIRIESNVVVQKQTWLAAVPLTGSKSCLLTIGKGSVIGHFNHIYATKQIVIGENVLTADKVYIADNSHKYEDVSAPILEQGIKQLNPVYIGDGTWIGENVCVIGASIGKNCVIGANSVVNTDIPDYCVAVGAPARVIKKYSLQTKKWEKN